MPEIAEVALPAESDVLAPLYPLPRPQLVSGRGAWVKDQGGREYLDFVSGIAVNALGHCPPGFARAIARQMGTLGQVSNLFGHAPGLELAAALTRANLSAVSTPSAPPRRASPAATSSRSAAASTAAPRSRSRPRGRRPTASRSSRSCRACASRTSIAWTA